MNETNARAAYKNYKLWLSWYPNDIKGAIEFASDYLDTEEDVDEFETILKSSHTIKMVLS